MNLPNFHNTNAQGDRVPNVSSIIVAALCLPFLASCGSLSSNHKRDFQCTAVLGQPCTTISAADGNEAGGNVRNVTPEGGNTVKPHNPRPFFKGFGKGNRQVYDVNLPSGGLGTDRNLAASRYDAAAQRVPERLGTLWVASYLDEDGILHDASYVHFVIQKGAWSGVH